MAESVDAADSKSAAARCEGSSPSLGTTGILTSSVLDGGRRSPTTFDASAENGQYTMRASGPTSMSTARHAVGMAEPISVLPQSGIGLQRGLQRAGNGPPAPFRWG